MDMRKQVNDEIFELLLRNALIAKYENEAAEAQSEAVPHNYSEKFEKSIKKIGNSINRDDRIKTFGTFLKKFAVAAASIMGIIFGGLLTQPEVYAAVENVVKSIFSSHDSYTYQGMTENAVFDKNKQLGYVPDGYELRSVFYSVSDVALTYESSDEQYINFDYGLAENSQISIDNERHECVTLDYDGITYYFYKAKEDNSLNTIIWYDSGYYYSIDAQLSQGELVKIAENIIN